MKITPSDRIAVLMLGAAFVTLFLATAAFLALVHYVLSTRVLTVGIVTILFAMVFFHERLVAWLLIKRGYLCARCRSRSIVKDVERAVRGKGCVCVNPEMQ